MLTAFRFGCRCRSCLHTRADMCRYLTFALVLPRELLLNPSLWTPAIKGIAYGLPVASVIKLAWVFGMGRDVV
jgi:hypothetical protein